MPSVIDYSSYSNVCILVLNDDVGSCFSISPLSVLAIVVTNV